jgi:two-component system OmpR family sensor kinase
MSLYRRLLIAIVIAIVTVGSCCVAVYRVQEQFLIRQIDNRLLSLDRRLPAVVRKVLVSDRRTPVLETALSDIYVGRVGKDGGIETLLALVSRPNSDPRIVAGLENGRPITVESEDMGAHMRVLVSTTSTRESVVVGIALDDYLQNLQTLRNLLIALFAVSTAVILLVFWWVLVLGIRPIRRMVDVARQIADKNRRARMEENRSSSETAELSRALNQMIDSLDASERRMARFVADASHELRTPLSTLTGYSEIYLAGGLRDDAEVHDAMSRIRSTSVRMSGIVEDLLSLLSVDSMKERQLTMIDVSAVLNQCRQDAAVLDVNRVVTSSCEQDLTLLSNEEVLVRVLMVFVENAITHSRVHGSVAINAASEDGKVKFSVVDEGPGVPPHLVENIFEPFFKADDSRSLVGARSGLGLAIAKQLVGTLGGSIGVEPTPEGGASFWFALPNGPSP